MAVTRELIIDSFEKHLDSAGFRNTSVEDIARDLHISKKTIYVHFESKDDLYRHVAERKADTLAEHVAQALAALPTNQEKIEGLIEHAFAITHEWLLDSRDTEFTERYHYQIAEESFIDAYTGLFREYIHAGIAAGEFTAEDSEITVRLVAGLTLAGTRMLQEDLDLTIKDHVAGAVMRMLTC